MITAKCDQKGCDFSTTQQTASVANRVVGNHRRRVHGIIGKSVSSQWKAKQAGIVTGNSLSPQPEAAEAQPTVVPNFCPNCGCNLRVITAALNLRAKR